MKNRTPVMVNIVRVRTEFEVSQQRFAELIGINKGNMASYECGGCHPPLKVIKKILDFAEILNEDAYDFIYNFDFKYTKPKNNESVKSNG